MDNIIADNLPIHKRYMKLALKQAQNAMKHDEVPIGAVVIGPDGVVLGRGYNKVESRNMQTAHAEVIAIEKACKKKGDWRLDDCWIYVTLEPCGMCMHLIMLSRIKGVVFGASSPLFGFRLDKNAKLPLYKKHTAHIIKGVFEDEAALLLKRFFKQKRKKDGTWSDRQKTSRRYKKEITG